MIRWGIIGPGGIARRFAHAMTAVDDGEIVAVSSRSLDRANAFGDEHGVAHRYDDDQALADDPQVDAVYVATPHSRHEVDTIRASRRASPCCARRRSPSTPRRRSGWSTPPRAPACS